MYSIHLAHNCNDLESRLEKCLAFFACRVPKEAAPECIQWLRKGGYTDAAIIGEVVGKVSSSAGELREQIELL